MGDLCSRHNTQPSMSDHCFRSIVLSGLQRSVEIVVVWGREEGTGTRDVLSQIETARLGSPGAGDAECAFILLLCYLNIADVTRKRLTCWFCNPNTADLLAVQP